MVFYFIIRHICMIGSHRPVRRQGRKPGTSSPTRRRLGRGDGRRQVDSCQVQAVLPVVGTGTTGQRYYRPLLPLATDGSNGCSKTASGTTGPRAVLPDSGTAAPSYRSPQAPPTEAPGPQAVLPLRKRYYRLPLVLPVAGPVLLVLPDPDRLSSALCLVTLPITYLFVPKLPLFCGWTIYSPHPLL